VGAGCCGAGFCIGPSKPARGSSCTALCKSCLGIWPGIKWWAAMSFGPTYWPAKFETSPAMFLTFANARPTRCMPVAPVGRPKERACARDLAKTAGRPVAPKLKDCRVKDASASRTSSMLPRTMSIFVPPASGCPIAIPMKKTARICRGLRGAFSFEFLVRHKNRNCHAGKNSECGPTKDEFAQARMTITAHYNHAG
jgi:hypothetical protein